ncbi:hypothetical protein [Streptomyces collinus]|uniref:Uncharacterized protein n=1 Tax=Streptomyces collinus (strain DSM 40733 / Tue 365) TaxID=1214242 RepID=S5W1K2_STRC3|nr:hypothetical protein [Streptomyces collinus]AGS73955.1 hypothetical protein B446_35983 [Streptomyces collinus Tu 365]
MSQRWPLTRVPDDVPSIPEELASLSLSALMLALGTRDASFDQDPHADVLAHNWTRLLRRRFPVLCDGPGHVLTIGRRTVLCEQ